MTTMRTRHVIAAGIISAALLAPSPARAGGHVDADLDFGAPLDNLGYLAIGAGGRVGWRFELGPVWLQPEAGVQDVTFLIKCSDCGSSNPHLSRVFTGIRLGGMGLISGVIEPALFGHAGGGWVTALAGVRDKGSSLDVGFAVDVRALRSFRFGVQGAYNVVKTSVDVVTGATQGSVRWLSYGLHAGATF